MQFPSPPMPTFTPDRAADYDTHLRYEDVAQDGRLMPIALPPAMSGLWRSTIANTPASRASLAKGIIPLLTRLTLATTDAAIRVDRPARARSGLELAHATQGDVLRIYMNIWSEVSGIAGRVGPRQAAAGPLVVAGTMFAEHTFTRPLAPPDQRRVTALEGAHGPEVPPARYDAPHPETAQEAPAGATWLTELLPDPTPVIFTLDQTDSNQHVNSLVYIRTFLDAAQRRLAAAGLPRTVRSRAVDIAYRKPCFAGDQVSVVLRLFDTGDGHGAAGYIIGEDGKPRCYARVAYGR